MWNDNGFELVMLPTEAKESIGMLCARNTDGKLCQHTKEINWHGVNQYLYLLSDEEIREGDLIYLIVIDVMGKEVPVIIKKKVGIEYMDSSAEKKVIATNDPSLNLPQFPDIFLQTYVRRYNSKQSLKVEVDYLKSTNSIWDDLIVICENTISIRFKEEKSITHDVVREAMRIVSKDVREPNVIKNDNN